jgi:hypothetical protein
MSLNFRDEENAWIHQTLCSTSHVENACKGRFRSPKRIDLALSKGEFLNLVEMGENGTFQTCSSQSVLSSIYQIKMLPSTATSLGQNKVRG